jgi:hypothetical protein
VTVVTDLQRAGWEDEEPMSVPGGIEIELLDAGAPAGNAAVVAIGRGLRGIVVSIRNEHARRLAGTLRVRLDGRLVASQPFAASARGTVDVPIGHRLPETGPLTVEIDDRDGFPADDTRHLILDAQDRRRILVIGTGAEQSGFYVTRALQAAGTEDSYEVRSVTAASAGRIDRETFARTGAVLLLSTKGLDRAARDMLAMFVRSGGGLLAAAAPDVEPSSLASVMGWPDFAAVEQPAASTALAATDLRHPVFRPVGLLAANLGQVRFTRAWRVSGAGWDIAARFTDGTPALLERREGQGRVVLFASDLDRRWNDFPLHPAFVPFVLETFRHIVASSDHRRDYVVADAPAAANGQPGIHTLQADGRRIAVNVDVLESATSRLTPDEFKAMLRPDDRQTSRPAGQLAHEAEGRQNLWRYGLLLMLAALAAESVVGRRT